MTWSASRLAQALHHGTNHRSQICTALASLGVEPPSIDVWDYALEVGRSVERLPDGTPPAQPSAGVALPVLAELHQPVEDRRPRVAIEPCSKIGCSSGDPVCRKSTFVPPARLAHLWAEMYLDHLVGVSGQPD